MVLLPQSELVPVEGFYLLIFVCVRGIVGVGVLYFSTLSVDSECFFNLFFASPALVYTYCIPRVLHPVGIEPRTLLYLALLSS